MSRLSAPQANTPAAYLPRLRSWGVALGLLALVVLVVGYGMIPASAGASPSATLASVPHGPGASNSHVRIVHLSLPSSGLPCVVCAWGNATPTTGVSPLAVHFFGNVTGTGTPPYTFSWVYGDGSFRAGHRQNETHTYAAGGNYIANFTVNDSVGNSNSTLIFLSITQGAAPLAAAATATPNTGNAPLAVTFNGTATGGTPPYTWYWTYGDGSAGSHAENPVHTYNATGFDRATLTVNDSAGHTAAAHAFVDVTSPGGLTVTAIATPTIGPAPLSVNFTSFVGGPPGAYAYSWTFGDNSGPPSLDATPNHVYNASGKFTASVNVTEPGTPGVYGVGSVTITVNVSTILHAVATATPTVGDVSLTVQFNGTATGGTAPYTWSWSFGDASTDGTTENPSHTYTSPGSYSAVLTVTDNTGAHYQAAAVPITVHALPAATASATPTSGTAPLVVAFTGGASSGTGPFTWSWNFGDGSAPSTLQSPSHTYTSAIGSPYTATLTATDASGKTAQSSVTITVSSKGVGTLQVAASGTPVSGAPPLAVAFTGTASGGTAPYAYSWNFGDGSPASHAQDPSHTYNTTGGYTATFTVADSAGDQNSRTVNVTVASPLTASATASSTKGSEPLTVSFTGSSTGGTGGDHYSWSFGDGASSQAQDPVHVYNKTGTFTAALTVTDSAGQLAWSNVTITVTSSSSTTAGGSALSNSYLWVAVIAIVAVAAIVGLLYMRRRRGPSASAAPAVEMAAAGGAGAAGSWAAAGGGEEAPGAGAPATPSMTDSDGHPSTPSTDSDGHPSGPSTDSDEQAPSPDSGGSEPVVLDS